MAKLLMTWVGTADHLNRDHILSGLAQKSVSHPYCHRRRHLNRLFPKIGRTRCLQHLLQNNCVLVNLRFRDFFRCLRSWSFLDSFGDIFRLLLLRWGMIILNHRFFAFRFSY